MAAVQLPDVKKSLSYLLDASENLEKTVNREQKSKNGRTVESLEWLCEAKPFQSSTMDWLCEAKQSNQNGLALRSKANPSLKRL